MDYNRHKSRIPSRSKNTLCRQRQNVAVTQRAPLSYIGQKREMTLEFYWLLFLNEDHRDVFESIP